MIRKLSFGFVIVTAFIVAACGRQVTPNPPGLGPGGAPPGYMSVVFDIAGTFNFSNYQYWVVFNTTGNNITPSVEPFNNNWAGYSFAVEVAGNGVTSYAVPVEFVRSTAAPHAQPYFQRLVTTPHQFQYLPNSNGTSSEFTVLFQRNVFSGIATPTPGPSPTSSAQPFANTWYFNAFTTQTNGLGQLTFMDSLGAGGPVLPDFVSPALNIRTTFQLPEYALFSGQQMDPNAQISQVTISNNASPTPKP